MLTHRRLLEVLDYDPQTGEFRWKIDRNSHRGQAKKGNIAGCLAEGTRQRVDGTYYHWIIIGIDGKTYKAHRLAWFYVHGVWPIRQIDHKDRNPLNNAISNLREATNSQQAMNKVFPKNKTGYRGVKTSGKDGFMASIWKNDKYIYLGRFKTAEEASAAYEKAAKELFGEFKPD